MGGTPGPVPGVRPRSHLWKNLQPHEDSDGLECSPGTQRAGLSYRFFQPTCAVSWGKGCTALSFHDRGPMPGLPCASYGETCRGGQPRSCLSCKYQRNKSSRCSTRKRCPRTLPPPNLLPTATLELPTPPAVPALPSAQRPIHQHARP